MDGPGISLGKPEDPTLVINPGAEGTAPPTEPTVPEPACPEPESPVVSPEGRKGVNKLVLFARFLVLSPIATYVFFLIKAYGKISDACKTMTVKCVYDDTYTLQVVTLLQAVLMFLLMITLILSGINVHRLVKGKDKIRGKGWVIAIFLALACGGASYEMFML
jgi:hypothetical protein